MDKITNTIEFLEAGLRAEELRQRAIANNIANIETPGYRSKDVEFEKIFAKALTENGQVDEKALDSEICEVGKTPVKANGNDVVLDVEVGKMIKNTLRHTTYMRLLTKKYRQMQMAISTK
jgi:flagellar basal-body rod protein FlgB